jgi:hypothetical protein
MLKLIDRLKPGYKFKLKEAQMQYPAVLERTIIALNTVEFYGELKVYDALNLSQFLTDHKINIHFLRDELFTEIKYK